MRGRLRADQTPVMRQYNRIKKEYPDKILLFRMGDFYEMFYEDAKVASRVLGIALTSRQKGDGAIPMAGVPYHSATTYIRRLLNEGYSVAICEQIEEPSKGKRLLERAVTRVITPGTIVEEELLGEGGANNNIAAVFTSKEKASVAWADTSTGEFYVTESTPSNVIGMVGNIDPSEIILPENAPSDFLAGLSLPTVRRLPDYEFEHESAYRLLCEHFGVVNLDGFGMKEASASVSAAGALLRYIKDNHKEPLAQIRSIRRIELSENLIIDRTTARSLELTESISGNDKGTLLSVLDSTVTPMGKRLLRKTLLAPTRNVTEISERLDAVEELLNEKKLRRKLRERLRRIGDLSRLATRILLKRCNGRDLNAVASALENAALLRIEGASLHSALLRRTVSEIEEAADVCTLIRTAIVDDPPATVKDGGIIREKYNERLDRLRDILSGGREWLSEFEAKERRRTKIANLKVGYNRLFGYYIEVPQSRKKDVPTDYRPLQTLKYAQRYETDELKSFERESLSASERAAEMEYELFCAVRDRMAERAPSLYRTAEAVSLLDMLCSFAEVAEKNHYCRPSVNETYILNIKEGRHPIIEQNVDFIPNDTYLDPNNGIQILLVTGPNMAGKSTYIRQVALVVIMAQMGSFVPASSATIGVCDRIFTRVGASDELYRGRSTFLVEMAETANILNNATQRSLIILDEIGRGTSTFDGLAIAWAVTEHIHDRLNARTLFATHYHELTHIAKTHPSIKNLYVAVTEYRGKVVFLHSIKEGAVDRSYGINVAELAGVPKEVVRRAYEVLTQLEAQSQYSDGTSKIERCKRRQLTLFDEVERHLVDELSSIDPDRLTPLEALQLIHSLKQTIERRLRR